MQTAADNRTGKGFTLAELLIVVAIIAVLVAVAIPVFSGQLKKAQAATCAANRRSLSGELGAEYLLDPSNAEVSNGTHQLTAAQQKEFTCPAGGTITYKIDTKAESITVSCSVHAKASVFGDADSVDDTLAILKPLGTIDSTATAGNNTAYQAAVKAFETTGIDMSDVKAWRYNGDYLYFALEPIPQDHATTMYFIQYNGTSKHYTVWKTTTRLTTPQHDPTKPYYIFGGVSGKPLNPDVADQTYEKALATYKAAIAG